MKKQTRAASGAGRRRKSPVVDRPTIPAPASVAETMAARTVAILRKELGGDAASNLKDGIRSAVTEVLPTGIDVLDNHVLGIGGLPYGRVVQIYGRESSGKSSLGWQLMAQGQRDGALVAFGEAEQALAPNWIDMFGVNRAGVVSIEAETFEDFSQGVDVMLEKAKAPKMLIILDSVPNCLPAEAIKAYKNEKETYALIARAYSEWLPIVTRKLTDRNAVLVLMNQLRAKIGVMFGPKEEPPGGNAIRFYSSIILQMWHGENEKKGETKVGHWSGLKATKNKLAPPFRETNALLSFDRGWDNDATTLAFAKETGCVGRDCKSVEEARQNLGWTTAGVPAEEKTK